MHLMEFILQINQRKNRITHLPSKLVFNDRQGEIHTLQLGD